jgi:SAM-dependent methyltransferase
MQSDPIQKYYDDLAAKYDTDRFENSYGTYLHNQEEQILKKLLKGASNTLSLCCGTGRFMELATTGLDFSANMINVAKQKYPGKEFIVADAEKTGLPENKFDAIFCLHAIMHLPPEKTKSILAEAHRILSPGGALILDFPSKKRRNLSKRSDTKGWHGSSAYTVKEIKLLAGDSWQLIYCSGVLFFPIHRIPAGLRKFLSGIDSLLCRSFLKNYSSYLVVALKKK